MSMVDRPRIVVEEGLVVGYQFTHAIELTMVVSLGR